MAPNRVISSAELLTMTLRMSSLCQTDIIEPSRKSKLVDFKSQPVSDVLETIVLKVKEARLGVCQAAIICSIPIVFQIAHHQYGIIR